MRRQSGVPGLGHTPREFRRLGELDGDPGGGAGFGEVLVGAGRGAASTSVFP